MDCTYFVILKDDHPELGDDIGSMGRSRLRLLEAIRDGDPQKIESLLNDRFFKLPVKDFVYIFSLLARLVKDKKVDHSIAVSIVKYGLNNYRGVLAPKMYRLYRWAVQLNSPAMVKMLLDAGLGVNEKIDMDDTLLSYAVTNGQSNGSIVSLLLSQGAEINSKDRHGNSILHEAVKTGNSEMVQLLLNNGADVTATDSYGQNCLHMCVESQRSCLRMAKLLIEYGAPLDVPNGYGRSPLLSAAADGHDELVRLYVDRGADIDALTKEGTTALFEAAVRNKYSTVELLLKKGADVNKGTTTPLHGACHKSTIDVLLKYGADVNLEDKESGLTPLSNFSKLDPDAKRIVVKHLASLIVQNLRVDERNLAYIRADEHMREFYERCYDELKRMSLHHFYNKITYYYIYSMDMDKLLPLFRNDEFVRAFEAKRIEKLFPLYCHKLNYKFRLCLTENAVQNFMKKSFELKVAAVFPGQRLPDLVKDKIFSHYVALHSKTLKFLREKI